MKRIIFILIIIVSVILTSLIFGPMVIDSTKPCLEYETFCYYISGGGGVAGSLSYVYIDCNDTDHIPKEIRTERRCIRK